MLFPKKEENKASYDEEMVTKDGIAVVISSYANDIWKVSVESRKPLEEFLNIRSRKEAKFIADRLFSKYEHFDVLMQVEK